VRSPFQAAAAAMFLTLGAQYTVVDSNGTVVGTLVTGQPAATQAQSVGITKPVPSPAPKANQKNSDMRDYWIQKQANMLPPMFFGGGAGE
jgi:hypothetical protein